MKKILLTLLLGTVFLGAAPLPMLVPAPVIDGKKGDKGWKNALKASFTQKKRGYVRLGRTADRLYVCVEFNHGNMNAALNLCTKHDSAVYDDDNLDFFFTPTPGKDNSYYQIIANVRGTIFDHFRDNNAKGIVSWDSGAVARGSYGKDSCYIEMSVPLSALGCHEGKLGVAVAGTTRWNKAAEAVYGSYHTPSTFTVFDIPDRFPVKLSKRAWAYAGGEQSSFLTLENISSKDLKLTGDYNGRPLKVDIKAQSSVQLQCRSFLASGKEGRNTLRLFDGKREILRATRILTPIKLLNVFPVSDVVYENEPVPLKISVNEKQTENVLVEYFPDKVVCSYKGEKVEVPFKRISSPWK